MSIRQVSLDGSRILEVNIQKLITGQFSKVVDSCHESCRRGSGCTNGVVLLRRNPILGPQVRASDLGWILPQTTSSLVATTHRGLAVPHRAIRLRVLSSPHLR